MTEVKHTRVDAPPGWPPHLERRRPGRSAAVSPELVVLLRDPAQHHRLLRDHLDLPHRAEPPRRLGPTVGLAASVLSCVVGWSVTLLLLYMAWG